MTKATELSTGTGPSSEEDPSPLGLSTTKPPLREADSEGQRRRLEQSAREADAARKKQISTARWPAREERSCHRLARHSASLWPRIAGFAFPKVAQGLTNKLSRLAQMSLYIPGERLEAETQSA